MNRIVGWAEILSLALHHNMFALFLEEIEKKQKQK
jgi:hypothetical protein